ncbi:DUF4190 domain-containing protein [Nocardioides panacisoli]|uniref:DUF4190 domain-containing protein n=1 Tax=Nocardioides panacisoli TaxID=627624 RepID=UPI001C6266DF|nr:DUF4190 domain-containing protein [Nocardioides panacisoli]QYJ04433.1 DUF4190 domain-containing protein [Nocardioides panacisoli]
MTTSGGDGPYYGSNDSNPYGATPPPPPPPGGSNPYAPAPGGASPGAPMDGVSVAALVTTVLCCTGPVAVVLGIIGIVRTKDGQRRGRWMAVVGVVGGILATAVVATAVGLGVWFGNQVVTPGNAERGQCVDVQEDGDTVIMLERDCEDDHDAEIVHADEYDASADGGNGEISAAICIDNLSSTDISALQEAGIEPGDLDVVAPDPTDMADGDPYACYVEPDRTLSEPLLD